MSIRVHISWLEHYLPVLVGLLRHTESTRDRYKAIADTGAPRKTSAYVDGDLDHNDVQAAPAEMVVAKTLDRYWRAGVNTHSDPDVGEQIEVRRTEYTNGKLIIRPSDSDKLDRIFVLVRGAIPDFEIVGWLRGHEAMEDRYRKDPNGNGECWMVPESGLKDIELLKALLKGGS